MVDPRSNHSLETGDLVERLAAHHTLGAAPRDALAGHSHVESFQDAVAAALEQQDRKAWNSLFLLYDCAYDPGQARPSAACRLRFVEVFRYSQG